MSDKHDHYHDALLEDIDDKLRGITEVVGGLADTVECIDRRLETVEQIAPRRAHVNVVRG